MTYKKKVDENSNMINHHLSNLERNYDELKNAIKEKMNRLEMKQKQDFYNMNKYIETIKLRKINNYIDQNNNIRSRNTENYQPNGMFSEKVKQDKFELIHTIKSLPNFLDNMVNEIENMRKERNKQKLNFLYDLSNNINKELNNSISSKSYEDINNIYDDYKNYDKKKDNINDLLRYNDKYRPSKVNYRYNRYDSYDSHKNK